MKHIVITINGEAYPCSPTMGAMLRFTQETGREITEINASSFSDLCTYLWCCVVAASNREGKKFEMSLMDFADNLTPEDMTGWQQAIISNSQPEGDDPDTEKKSPQGFTTS